MTGQRRDFSYSDSPEPHRERTRQILKQHPEIRALITRNPYSFGIIALIVSLQTAVAYVLRDQPWWVALIVAYLLGSAANHTLFVLIHEATHNLIFKKKVPNMLAGILADLPNAIPSAISFRNYHMKHHSFQGNYDLDADLPNRWEARLVGSTFVGKALWLLFYPVFQGLRPPRLKEIEFVNVWTMLNWLLVFGYDALILILFGPASLLYLIASLFFAIGLHPLGARWIQEHYLVSPPQETYSYYGPVNTIALNVGYHNEHHDFSSVPWNNLPRVKASAPEWYNTLVFHRSWTALLLRFLFDRNLSLYSRMLRTNRGAEALQPGI